MPTLKLRLSRRAILLHILLVAALVSAAALFYFILSAQMNYLSYALYDRSHLSQVYSLLNTAVSRKIVVCLILLVAMLLCYATYYASYFNLVYLRNCLLCVLTAMYCISLLETNTMVQAGQVASQLWNKLHFWSLFLYLWIVLRAMFVEPYSKRFVCWILIPCAIIYGLSLCLFMTFRYSEVMRLLLPLSVLWFAAVVILLLQELRRRKFSNLLSLLPPLFGQFAVLFANIWVRFRPYDVRTIAASNQFYNSTIFLALFIAIYLIVRTLILQREMLRYSRETKRRIYQVEQVRADLNALLTVAVRPHIGIMEQKLEELSILLPQPGLFPQVEQLKHDLLQINLALNRVNEYAAFQGNTLDQSLKLVNICTLIQMQRNALRHSNVSIVEHMPPDSPSGRYVRIAPVRMAQMMEEICRFLHSLRGGPPLEFSCQYWDNAVLLTYHIPMLSMLSAGDTQSGKTLRRLNDLLSMCRAVLLPFHGSIIANATPNLQISIQLPWAKEPTPQPMQETHCPSVSQSSGTILFLSTDPHQQALVLSMLPTERYEIVVSNDAGQYGRELGSLRRFSLVIIGNLYYDMDYDTFLHQVRVHYSITQLPILFLLPEDLSENEFHIPSSINQYLISPFSAVALQKTVDALISMKKSADRAIEANLELLQSQINPHFIFNAITAIMQLCIQAPLKAYELLESFSEYLRGHLSTTLLNRATTVQEEIGLISAYLEIEHARFGDNISYFLNIQCQEDFPILPLLIEPLVENSIKHCVKGSRKVYVQVDIHQQDNQLHVSVRDNGQGMPANLIANILEGNGNPRSIGLRNVCQRLRYYYNTVPEIYSSPERGTKISFTLTNRIDQS